MSRGRPTLHHVVAQLGCRKDEQDQFWWHNREAGHAGQASPGASTLPPGKLQHPSVPRVTSSDLQASDQSASLGEHATIASLYASTMEPHSKHACVHVAGTLTRAVPVPAPQARPLCAPMQVIQLLAVLVRRRRVQQGPGQGPPRPSLHQGPVHPMRPMHPQVVLPHRMGTSWASSATSLPPTLRSCQPSRTWKGTPLAVCLPPRWLASAACWQGQAPSSSLPALATTQPWLQPRLPAAPQPGLRPMPGVRLCQLDGVPWMLKTRQTA